MCVKLLMYLFLFVVYELSEKPMGSGWPDP